METSLFEDERELKQHEDAIDRLCQEHPDQCDLIRDTYLQHLEPMLSEARIRTYLSIFVSRKVTAELNKH